MPDAQTEAAMLIEALTQFAARHGIDAMLDLIQGVQLAYEPFGSEDRAGAEIEVVTVQ